MKNVNQNGRSMVEMLGVLAIIGVLSAGGLAGYSKAMFKHKLNTTMDQITMLVTNIRTMYGTQGDYTGLDNEAAVNLGIVPAVMGSGATLTNPFKGGVKIVTADAKTASTAGNTGFVVAYDSLPREACIALATADFGSGAGSGFIGVNVLNDGTVAANIDATKASTAIGTNEGKALDMSAAISDCADGSKNAVVWKFY
ncbi:MAG: hypothetical protein IJ830_02150 [Alphaproteobacteria bacterium]|nr:hypothetical protein [Alphaproteobacteria bacterium]